MIVPGQVFKISKMSNFSPYFKQKGYDFSQGYAMVNLDDLNDSSHQKVKLICDCCGRDFEREYRHYLISHKEGDYCRSCTIAIKNTKTNMKKYGVANPMQCKEIQDKVKQTNLQKYGVEHPSQNYEVQKKRENTMKERFGYISPLSNEAIKEKIRLTNLERYGVDNPLKNKDIYQKCVNTLNENGTQKTSSQQLKVYELLEQYYADYDIQLNYPFRSFNFDVALIKDDLKIDVEYDGGYWHQNQQTDRRRDEVSKSHGWKILRIKSGHKVPTIEQLVEAINKLINGYSYTEIKLEDWRDAA